MGAWGHQNFENDDALDFCGDLFESDKKANDLLAVINAVVLVANEALEAPQCCEALAAIEFVAAAKGKPSPDFPEEGAAWLEKNDLLNMKTGGILGFGAKRVNIEDISKEAIRQIKDSSELKELWEESGDYDKWLAVLADLEKRIA